MAGVCPSGQQPCSVLAHSIETVRFGQPAKSSPMAAVRLSGQQPYVLLVQSSTKVRWGGHGSSSPDPSPEPEPSCPMHPAGKVNTSRFSDCAVVRSSLNRSAPKVVKSSFKLLSQVLRHWSKQLS